MMPHLLVLISEGESIDIDDCRLAEARLIVRKRSDGDLDILKATGFFKAEPDVITVKRLSELMAASTQHFIEQVDWLSEQAKRTKGT